MSGGARSSARGGGGARQHVGQQKELVRSVQVSAATGAGWPGIGGKPRPFGSLPDTGLLPRRKESLVLLLFCGNRIKTKLWSPQVTERVVSLLLSFLSP